VHLSGLEQIRIAEAEVARLQGRVNAVDAKVYGDVGNLTRAVHEFHQPLAHTFDRSRHTQQLRDGVAVTQAFGKEAFRFAGTFAQDRARAAQQACGGKEVRCPEADLWRDGGTYKALLHAVIGAVSFGQVGAVANLTAELADPAIRKVLAEAGITEANNPALFNLLMAAGKSVVGAGVGGMPAAVTAFNADSNNRQLHTYERDWIRRNRAAFARQQGISEEEAERRLAEQAFRQVQFGAAGADDPAARMFLGLAPRVNLPGDPTVAGMNAGYMFHATPEQRMNASIYLHAQLNDPSMAEFYRSNGLTQPTIDQIASAAHRDAAARDAVRNQTIVAALASGALVLAPSVAGSGTAVAAFAADPKGYCLANPASCTVAAEALVCGMAGAACPAGALTSEMAAANAARVAARATRDPVLGSAAARVYSHSSPLDEIFPELRGVNPNYVENAGVGANTNCVSCVNAADARLRGVDLNAVAGPNGPYETSRHALGPAAPFGFLDPMSPAQVQAEMLARGNGSAGAVLITQPGTTVQHVINVVNRNGTIYFVDAQIGRIVTLQPGLVVTLSRPR
jgi:hypothetical protein